LLTADFRYARYTSCPIHPHTDEAVMTEPTQLFRRVHYFSGMQLTAEDLAREQEYHSGKRRLQNRLVLGMGIATGLQCRWSKRKGLILEPGVAIDCMGREIVVPERQHIPVPDRKGPFYLGIAAIDRGVSPIPLPGSEDVMPSRIEEGFEVMLLDDTPYEGHAVRPDGRRACCGGDHPVPLARLRWKKERLRVRP
jgi:hypothetical protein